MTDKDLEELYKKVQQLKIDILFEEPCPIYDGVDEDWVDYWSSIDK